MDGAESFERKHWKPMKFPWALQKAVVGAAIEVLEKGNAALDDVAGVIHEIEVLRSSLVNTRHGIRTYIKKRYGTVFEEGGREKLLADLKLQMGELNRHKGPVSLTASIRNPEELGEIHRSNEEYDKRRAEGVPPVE